MNEITVNLHIHTRYSDGTETHSQIANHAMDAGLDALIITDHNVLVKGVEGYFSRGDQKVLLLVGEEIHDQDLMPQKNHMLVMGARRELAPLAKNTQQLLDEADSENAVTFLAHPYESALPLFGETDISWENWNVKGFTGLELWNHFSSFKDVVHSLPSALKYAFAPERIARTPNPLTLKKWDELLASGGRIAVVGGADAHALHYRKSFLHKRIFPYEFHFRCINNHLLLKEPFNGDVDHDRTLVYQALRQGAGFVGYDLPAPTRGFRFTAENEDQVVSMGEVIQLTNGITLRIQLPRAAECNLVRHGKIVSSWQESDRMVATVTEPGAYRVECKIDYLGEKRGWIYSNPIYVIK